MSFNADADYEGHAAHASMWRIMLKPRQGRAKTYGALRRNAKAAAYLLYIPAESNI